MDLPLALAVDWNIISYTVKEKIGGSVDSLVQLIRTEVIRGTQVRNIKEVPFALTKMVTKELVQIVAYDTQHKIEAIIIGISLHKLYVGAGLQEYLPEQLGFLSNWKASAAVGLGSMFASRLLFIGLVGPFIRYHKKIAQPQATLQNHNPPKSPLIITRDDPRWKEPK